MADLGHHGSVLVPRELGQLELQGGTPVRKYREFEMFDPGLSLLNKFADTGENSCFLTGRSQERILAWLSHI